MRARLGRSVRPSVRPSGRRAPPRPLQPRGPRRPRARPACGPRPRPRRAPAAADWPAPRPGRGHRPGPRPRRPGRAPRPSLSPGLRAAGREGARQGSVLLWPPCGRPDSGSAAWSSLGIVGSPLPWAAGGGGGAAWGLRAPAPFPVGRSSRKTTRMGLGSGRGHPSPRRTAHPSVAQAPAPPGRAGPRATGCSRAPTRSRAARVSQTSRLTPPAQAAVRAARWAANGERESAPTAPQGPGHRAPSPSGDLSAPRARHTWGAGHVTVPATRSWVWTT